MQLIWTSLQSSIINGIQKHKIPVKQNKQTDQLIAVQPIDELTKSVSFVAQTGQGVCKLCKICG
jgi:hypothetical protein